MAGLRTRCVSALLALAALAACSNAPRVYKVALVAPFEGHARDTGYAVFPGFRAGLQSAMIARPDDRIQLTFVAYNDNAEPVFAARVAQNVVLDTDVLFVVGHLLPQTTAAALPVYQAGGMPVLARCAAGEAKPGVLWCSAGDIAADAARAGEWLRDAVQRGEAPDRALAARALDAVAGSR